MTGSSRPAWSLWTCLALLASMAGCGDGNAPTKPEVRPPSLQVVFGQGQSDTIEALTHTDLVVEVRDTLGRPWEGVTVSFEGKQRASDDYPLIMAGYLGLLTEAAVVLYPTSRLGRASAHVRMGLVTGTYYIQVRVPELNLRDSVAYVVLPGHPVRMGASPPDTTVTLSKSVVVRAYAVDRLNNPRPESAAYTTSSPLLSVSATGLLTGLATGRGYLYTAVDGLRDSVGISVVPPGTLLARTGETIISFSVFETDLTPVATIQPRLPFPLEGAALSPQGDRIVFQTSDGRPGRPSSDLYASDFAGTSSPLIPLADTVRNRLWAQYSSDGTWIYYHTAWLEHAIVMSEIWRVHPDGSDNQRLLPASDTLEVLDAFPSPSPDGKSVAFAGYLRDGGTIHILDLASGSLRDLGVTGDFVRWSPRNDQIAFDLTLDLYVVQVDGTGYRRLGGPNDHVLPPFDWSPDGKWIVFRDGAGLKMVEVSTNKVIPLASTAAFSQPVWRR